MPRGTLSDRLLLAIHARDTNQRRVALAVGMSPQTMTKVLDGRMQGRRHWGKLAEVLDVPVAWLADGEEEPGWLKPLLGSTRDDLRGMVADLAGEVRGISPAWAATAPAGDLYAVLKRHRRRLPPHIRAAEPWLASIQAQVAEAASTPGPESEGETAGFSYVGTVSSSDGMLRSPQESELKSYRLKGNLAMMQVEGWMAYPFAFPGQYILFNPDIEEPHDRNIVVCFSHPGEDDERIMLKRYIEDERAPHGFILASINAGLDAYVFDEMPVMHPVVGVVFPHALEGVDVDRAREVYRDGGLFR